MSSSETNPGEDLIVAAHNQNEKQPTYILILIVLILSAGILAAGFLYYRNYEKQYRVEVEQKLTAIADLKVGELVQWRRERLGDAAVFFRNEAFSSLVRRYFNNPNDPDVQRPLWTWLSIVQILYSYERIFLFDARGAKRMSIPDSQEPVDSNLARLAAIVMGSGQIYFQDFYRDGQDQRIYLNSMIPILGKEGDNRALGVIALRVDPETYLYPFLSRWPAPSRTAETLLVRREGGEVVFLNELRFQKNTALKLRAPMEKVELPAVKAVLGQEGIVEGNDYRGVKVMAAIRAIPDSPWFLVARMDASEVYAPIRERLWLMIFLIGALLTGTGSAIGLVWRRQHIRFYREKYEAEEALHEQEIKLSSIFRTAPVGIAMTINGAFKEANDTLCLMTGYSREEILGENTRILYPTREDYDCAGHEMHSLNAEESVGTVEIRWKKKDGTVMDILLGSTPLDSADLAKGVTFTALDITDRKKAGEEKRILEERLQHADKMEAVGTLAGGIAHDFNNLLMGIQGYASLTLLDLDPSHPHYERLKRIEEQVRSGADLTRQLLGFARGGRYEVKPADMNDIIKKSSSMFGRTKKEITIHRKYGKDLRSVEVDRGQMEQVFMNLYVNAWQAMPGGGEIYLATEDVFLNDAQAVSYSVMPGKYVKISVTDTGTGMDEKTRERIFDPFFTTKGMGRGTGLGLATVYGIIKGHRGMINVYSEPGHGTTFNIYLPASEREVIGEKTETGTIAMGTETILLADDEKMVLEVSREMLEFLGYRVYAAGSGQEALAVYMEKQKEIDLVILDMIMPGISGGETFDRLREINPSIRVLLSSGYSIEGQAQGILDRGCNGFLQKPFQLENLSRKVREMLD
jgi:two-component system cell cycle sensor histidine kinase/response regulator CckA